MPGFILEASSAVSSTASKAVTHTAAEGFVAGSAFATAMIIGLVAWVLLVVARWKLFNKAGEAGWKCIIPVYSDYINWKISWKKTYLFWVVLLLVVVGFALLAASGAITVGDKGKIVYAQSFNQVLAGIGLVLFLIAVVIDLICVFKMMRAFGHGGGFFILWILIPNIMMLVLGFGPSKWEGAQD